jgi:two-component system cell cycle response regulator
MAARILIVDDNPVNLKLASELLELDGYDARVFTSRMDALALNEQLEFDAALLDIRMPGIDGIALCAALAEKHPDAIFVLMTAFTSEQRLADARGSGACAVLKKPLPVDQLLSLLGGTGGGAVLVVEDDAPLRDGLAEVLAPHGYEVTSVSSIADARAVLARSLPSVAIVDVKLPDGSGAELARELVAKNVKVVLTTGYDEPSIKDSVSALRSRGARYLEKPFAPAALLELIASARRGGEAPQGKEDQS